MKKIILASASPRRSELLRKVGIVFEVLPAEGEERITCTSPQEVVSELSLQKARFTGMKLEEQAEPGVIVIGADTVVAFQGKILGKPHDKKEAFHTLQKLQGNTHQVYTGVTVLVRKENRWEEHTFYECTDVMFYPVCGDEIQKYVDSGDPLDKAGSYGIQGPWGAYVKGIHGDYNNVVGLPVARLIHEMKKIGIDLRG